MEPLGTAHVMPWSSLPTTTIVPTTDRNQDAEWHDPAPSVPHLSRRSLSLPSIGLWPWAYQYVDYLHHPWTDDDLTNSWKLVTKLKHTDRALALGGKGERLEYLTWRIWMQRTRRLPKTHPYTIHWEKDSSHLYAPGPLFRGKSSLHLLPADLPTPSSPPTSSESTPPTSPNATETIAPNRFKGCLKRPTLRDFLLRPLTSSATHSLHAWDPLACTSVTAQCDGRRRRRTAEEHEQLMHNALTMATTTIPASGGDTQHQQNHGNPASIDGNLTNDHVLVCTATASHPMPQGQDASAHIVRFNHIIEERIIAGPNRAVVVPSRKRRSRSLVLAVLDGAEAKAYKRVVDKWIGLDAGQRPMSVLTQATRGRPRARSDPPARGEQPLPRDSGASLASSVAWLPLKLRHHAPCTSEQHAFARAAARSSQDSAIAFSALVDDLLSSPDNEDAASFAGTPQLQSHSWPTTPLPSSPCRSPPPCDASAPALMESPDALAIPDLSNIDIDNESPTWGRSTLARGRDHAIPPFHVDESTLAMLALPLAVGMLPPTSTATSDLARARNEAKPPHQDVRASFLPTPPPSSPVAATSETGGSLDAVGRMQVPTANTLPTPIALPLPAGSPQLHPSCRGPLLHDSPDAPALATAVARGTGWGMGHLEPAELGFQADASTRELYGRDAAKLHVDPSSTQSNGSVQEVVATVADAVGWLFSMVVGRAGSFST